ncbi:DUF2142 domain-containing protein [Gryllotalpicola protaetiae]|nr:DUF2142 domain-containing protein [Gryllotalpicola protaetiae]
MSRAESAVELGAVSTLGVGARRPVLFLLIAWASAFVVFFAWVIATPVAASPDENAHLVKAAGVVRGQLTGEATHDASIRDFTLPSTFAQLGEAPNCFAFRPDTTADCSVGVTHRLPDTTTTAQSWVGNYNPLYYAVVGLPTLFIGGTAGALASRTVSALLASLFVALAFWGVCFFARRGLITLSLFVALTPAAYFLGAMVTPSGTESISVLTFAVLFAGLLIAPDAPLFRARVIACTVVAGIAVNLRALSPIFVLTVVLCLLIALPWRSYAAVVRRRSIWVAVVVIGVLTVGAGIWTVTSGLFGGFLPSMDPTRDSPARAFEVTLLNTPQYARDFIGTFGWLDTVSPALVTMIWALLAGLFIGIGLLFGTRRAGLAIGFAAFVFLFLPPLSQAQSVQSVGYIWQGRYILPVFTAGVFLCALFASRFGSTDRGAGANRLILLVGVPTAVLHLAAFFTALHRYSVGQSLPYLWAFTAPKWQPAIGNVGVLVLVSIGLAAVVLVARWTVGGRPATPLAIRSDVAN